MEEWGVWEVKKRQRKPDVLHPGSLLALILNNNKTSLVTSIRLHSISLASGWKRKKNSHLYKAKDLRMCLKEQVISISSFITICPVPSQYPAADHSQGPSHLPPSPKDSS